MRVVRGKVLLVIAKQDSKYVPFHITAFMQSCSDPDGADYMGEEFGMLETESGCVLPPCCHRLQVGECIRASAVYEQRYWQYPDGEGNGELHLDKFRVLRRQPAPKGWYASTPLQSIAKRI